MHLRARQVVEDDRSIFDQLHSSYINEGQPQQQTAPVGWLDNIYSQALAGQRYLWLARNGDEIVGFCSFRILPFFRGSSDKFTEIQDFYIVPPARGRGFGRQLAGLIMRKAIAQQAASVELDVAADNVSAMQFWERVGFKLRIYSMELKLPGPS